ncbi:class I SAM-dependent methyltransferase [Thermodesulfobacteriota bacterium]
MGLIFDINSARLYENWYRSPMGSRMESFFERLLIEFLEPEKQQRVIDIGCGAGNHLIYANKIGLSVTGIDASPYMIDLARSRLGRRSEIKKAYAGELPFEDNEFDFAFLINTLEFLDNPLEALREAGRVASRKVFIIVFNRFATYCQWKKLSGLINKNIFPRIRTYSLWDIKALIYEAYGSAPIQWQSEAYLPDFIRKYKLPLKKFFSINHLPFGFILGISITLRYTYKTDKLSLKEKIRRRKSPVVEGVHTISNFNGVLESERSISL